MTLLVMALMIFVALVSPWALSAVLIFFCGIFVAFEFAVVKASLSELEKDVQRGVPGAPVLVSMKMDLNATLAACQFGITLTSLGLTLALEPAIHALVSDSSWPLLANSSEALALGIGAFFHVTLGELVPKGLALVIPHQVLYAAAPFMRIFRWLAVPFIKSCNSIANVTVKALTGKNPDTDLEHESRMEVGEVLALAGADGSIGRRQLQLMNNVLDFADRTAREIMTPVRLVASLDTENTWEENLEIIEENAYSRFPVISGNPHNVIGYIHRAEILKAQLKGEEQLEKYLRPIDRRPETISLLHLNPFKGTPMVACYDEHDSFSGILTSEDVVEQIFGEIYDETDDVEAPAIEYNADGSVRVDGALLVEMAEQQLGGFIDLDDHQDVDTIGGLVLKFLARQPAPGDQVELGNWVAIVESAEGFRIQSLTFAPKNPDNPPPET